MPELGRAALIVCLGAALYAVAAGAYAAWRGRRGLQESAQNAIFAAFLAAAVASVVLLAALLRKDFSFTYVWQHTSRELPTAYTFSSFCPGRGFERRRPARPPPGPEPAALDGADPRRGHGVLRVHARGGLDALRDAGPAGRRPGPQSEPPEPVHDRPHAAPDPR